MSCYDETGLLRETAEDAGIDWQGMPSVRRRDVTRGDATVSALVWGTDEPELVLLHGGAQNAHTWDAVALALGLPLIAIDLPGHGHSSHRDPLQLSPTRFAQDIAQVVEQLAPAARTIVGMSLGGLTAFALADARPELVDRLAIVDVTPAVDEGRAAPIRDFVSEAAGPATFDELLELTVAFNPHRSERSLRRGLVHNTRPRPDGTVVWRHQLGDPQAPAVEADLEADRLWEAVDRLQVPLLLVLGGESQVVRPQDVDEIRRRHPDTEVLTVDGAGHSVQGDRPVELASALARFHGAG